MVNSSERCGVPLPILLAINWSTDADLVFLWCPLRNRRVELAWDENPKSPMLSRISRSCLCFANGCMRGDIRKSNSVPPLMLQLGGCTPLGLNRVMNRMGGPSAAAPDALRSIRFRNGKGRSGPAAPRRNRRRSNCQDMCCSFFSRA